MNSEILQKTFQLRSFVRREGRMTNAQKTALNVLWPKYGLSEKEVFKKMSDEEDEKSSVILEIGFGMGQSLLEMAKKNPHKNYIGIEVHRPGVGSLLAHLEEENITNVKVYMFDAVEVIKQCLLSNSLSEVYIYFPDPWPKKKHNKRRLIQTEFMQLIDSRLKPGGIVHCATDWEDYAHHMMRVLSEHAVSVEPQWINIAGKGQFSTRPDWRPETKFEQRGQRLGHTIYDLIFQKSAIDLKENHV